MSTARRYLPTYTVEDYQTWKGDWELWDGIAISMSPSPFGPHQKAATRLLTAFQNSIDHSQCDAIALCEIDWVVSKVTVVRPDILVLCGDAPQRHVEQTPAIVVEILSSSTEERDRNEKLDLYQQEKVRHYLILDPNQQSFEWFKLDRDGLLQPQEVGESIALDICKDCSLELVVAKLFA